MIVIVLFRDYQGFFSEIARVHLALESGTTRWLEANPPRHSLPDPLPLSVPTGLNTSGAPARADRSTFAPRPAATSRSGRGYPFATLPRRGWMRRYLDQQRKQSDQDRQRGEAHAEYPTLSAEFALLSVKPRGQAADFGECVRAGHVLRPLDEGERLVIRDAQLAQGQGNLLLAGLDRGVGRGIV